MAKSFLQDSHLHLSDNEKAEFVSTHPKIKRFFVNAVSSSDFQHIKKCSNSNNDIIPFYGIHPWRISENSYENIAEIQKIELFINSDKAGGIGECGLDFSIKYKRTQEEQIEVFAKQLNLSRKYNLPVSIHCIKAWSKLISLLKKNTPPAFMIHSFYTNIEIANELANLGAYFSLSERSFINPEKTYNIIKQLPIDKILVETDCFIDTSDFYSDNYYNRLLNNYAKTSKILSMQIEKLKIQVLNNGKVFAN